MHMAGENQPGGAPAQLQYTESTLILIIDESERPSRQVQSGQVKPTAVESSPVRGVSRGGEARVQGAGGEVQGGAEARVQGAAAAEDSGRVASEEEEGRGCCLGQLMGPPELLSTGGVQPQGDIPHEGAIPHDGVVPQEGVRLRVFDCRRQLMVTIELVEGAKADAADAHHLHRLCESLSAGHHIFARGLTPCAPAEPPGQGAGAGVQGPGAPAEPPPSALLLRGALRPTGTCMHAQWYMCVHTYRHADRHTEAAAAR